MKLAKVNNRLLFLSPTVQAGWQNQSFRTDFQNIKTLGKGAFGLVWQARHKKTGTIYAIKQIKKKAINTPKLLQHVKTQVRIMYLLNHPNIIKLYNHFQDDFSIYFILQYAQKGELYRYMMNSCPQRHFTQEQTSRYIKQIVEALEYIHQLNIIHRDIKPENILITSTGQLKLADFGWSNFVEQPHSKRETYCGTLDYLAPEMVQHTHMHDYRVDIWSLGVLIYQLINGISPFSYELIRTNTMSQLKVKQNISKVNYGFPPQISNEAKDLISRILVKEPQKRLSLKSILSHPWMKRYQIQKQPQYGSFQQQWLTTLKSEFSRINQLPQPQKNNLGINKKPQEAQMFTEQQIYNCTRIQGILNKKINQGIQRQNQKDRKITQLQLRVRELQLQNRIKQQEVKQLRGSNQKLIKHVTAKDTHDECRQKSQRLMLTIREQSEQIKGMHLKILQNQRKLRQHAQN